MYTVKVQKLIKNAKILRRAMAGAIGFGICSAHDTDLKLNEVTKIHTGIALKVPKGIYLRLAPRSSLVLNDISVEARVVDNDFRGKNVILLGNNSNKAIKIQEGQRATQGIFEQAKTPCIVLTDKLQPTARGNSEFGSTNKNYNKTNRDEAIACTLRVAMETHTQSIVNSLHNNEEDSYSELMKSDNCPQSIEGRNSHPILSYDIQK